MEFNNYILKESKSIYYNRLLNTLPLYLISSKD